jgi:hypothetical protein
MSGRRTFRICGKKLTIPATPKLPDMKWEDLVQPSPPQRQFKPSRDLFKNVGTGPKGSMKKVVRRKRARAAN